MTVKIPTMLDDERVAALNRIAELHDDAVVNASVAADFLGMHRKTLARLRRDGIAPPAIQYPERKTKSRNQALYFIMRDLRSYRDTNKTQSPIAAAKARGLTFSTLADLQREEPFWQQSGANGKGLVSHAMTITPKRYAELWCDPNAEIVWMSLDEALQCAWIDLEKRKIFDDAYEGVLSDLLARNEKRKMEDGLYAIAGPKTRSTQKKGAGKTSV